MKTKRSKETEKRNAAWLAGWFTRSEEKAVTRLCQIASALGVPVVSTRQWPETPDGFHLPFVGSSNFAGVHIPDSQYSQPAWQETRTVLEFFHVSAPPVILLRGSQPLTVLAHELGHAASVFADSMDWRTHHRKVSPLLNRVAARHGFSAYCRSTRPELRAECVGRRLLGENLPVQLRRLTERSWQDLHWKLEQRGERF